MKTNPALAVGCRYCHAAIDEPCINVKWNNQPLVHFLAHICREKDAETKTAAQEEFPF